MYDTIIIGAGMSGLAAGIRLAHFGRHVCILERHTTIGGLNSFYRLRNRDYDVGLHAVTNYVPRGSRQGPLPRLLKQLRFRWEDFALAPQWGSAIRFPGVELRFGNGLEMLQDQVAEKFPAESDRFHQLCSQIVDYDDLNQELFERSAREAISGILRDPLLMEMLLCPLMWYGNPREHDMNFGQFCIMFRSIFMEGFARPLLGVRLILKKLVRRYRELGGELKLRSGVQRIITDQQRAVGVELDDGTQLSCRQILSSAGWLETMRMCGGDVDWTEAGQLSFTESVSVLDRRPADVGLHETVIFFNDSERFHWARPEELCDVRTGVICSPNNYLYESPAVDAYLPDGIVRVTSIANYPHWCALDPSAYAVAKLEWHDRAAASAVRFVPDYRRHVIDSDFFTPKTVHRFTWHVNGAVYGATRKRLDGRTHLDNLFICGTDQGFVGIVGSIISGVNMANQHVLRQPE